MDGSAGQRARQEDEFMKFEQLDARERLIAEQAVLGFREVRRVVATAAHGRGLAATEEAALSSGRRQMRLVMAEALKDRSDAEEKGGAPANAAVGRGSAACVSGR